MHYSCNVAKLRKTTVAEIHIAKVVYSEFPEILDTIVARVPIKTCDALTINYGFEGSTDICAQTYLRDHISQ